MKKFTVLIIVLVMISGCRKVTLEKLQASCSENRVLLLYFGLEIEKPVTVKLDGQVVPIVSGSGGERLEIYGVEEGEHVLEMESKFYVFSKSVRAIQVNYSENCFQRIMVAGYEDKFIETETNDPSWFSGVLGKLAFWKRNKHVSDDGNKKIYGKFRN